MKQLLVLVSALAFFTLSAHAATPPAAVSDQLDILLVSIQNDDLETFHSVCNETMKNAMTPEILKRVSAQVAAPLKGGYTKTYFGELTRPDGLTGYYWKLHFKTKPDHDLLAEMWILDGQVAGFFLR